MKTNEEQEIVYDSKEALDNLHRCALCHSSEAENKNKWIKHCRKMRDIVDKDLLLLDLLWCYLHNVKLSEEGLKKIKEWFDNEK